MPGGRKQPDIARKYNHDLRRLYDDLPLGQKVLTPNETTVLRAANQIYITNKGFDYISPYDMGSGYSRFPNLAHLDAVARKLIGVQQRRTRLNA